MTIGRALISVYDKSGVEELAAALHKAGVEIVSTGSTAAAIAATGVPVTQVADVTGFPEILDGRVKTLHPSIHGGILADRRKPEHERTLAEHGITGVDLVVANLYPFTATVASGADVEECIEQIDIGGPAMVRAAAKNHANTAVIVSPQDYPKVIAVVEGGQDFTAEQRRDLAVTAFRHTADYDVAVASWLGSLAPGDSLPGWVAATWQRAETLRYGENPHQQAALYVNEHAQGLAHAEQLHGKAMSYNNYVDGDAAYRAAWDFEQPAAAIIKHANPCGIAVGPDLVTAYRAAIDTDPVSAFGGVVAVNRPVTKDVAQAMSEIFLEVVIAPAYDSDALDVLTAKQNIRLLVVPSRPTTTEVRWISGGMLMQSPDRIDDAGDDPVNWTLACGDPADPGTLRDLAFAWRACRAVKSNAILLAKNQAAVGIGMGQVNRVDSARLAVARAGEERASGAVAASDAFFPFPDGLEVLLDAGVRAVVQPGGSVRDDEVIAAARAAGATMYLTGVRHFYH
ncbi:MAG: bifunctional phosphoribosylaminoimidazolecarboxamide formyltransferase/IMP cyclohydrolase [Candidatus Nanopelagicales bacterium]